MPKRKDIQKILVIGSGPIVIGQAAEFDYAGTQACLAIKEEGYEVVLINSNPATIMTDYAIADKVYMEPLNLEFVSRVIRMERPDGIVCTLGGQTALNLAVQLAEKGILEECQTEILGTDFASIKQAEDRELFKELCQQIEEPILESKTVSKLEDVLGVANDIGYPIIVRPAFTLGGTGGGFANSDEEVLSLAKHALELSPVNQILIEKSIKGYKEIEYEVMRDANDTAIAICNMENIDPVGIHTGDSMVVCPTQTLTNKECQMLRNAALKIVRALNIKGGCNVQFALDPHSFTYYVIEVNPRVSRSSALASKASGYPIARVSAKIAIGLNLDEIRIANTIAAFEPALDYVVTKIARFPFDKFVTANKTLSTQMKATGEVMSIGRTFEESFLKAIRSLEIGVDHIYLEKFDNLDATFLKNYIVEATDERIFAIAELLRRNVTIDEIYQLTKIDKYFLYRIRSIIELENQLKKNCHLDHIKKAKRKGFSDSYLGKLLGMNECEFYKYRFKHHIFPVYKMIDTCAGEFASYIPYFYSSYEEENESIVSDKPKIIVLGSGPIRIGQGVEFDYSTVHAIWAIKEMGYEAIVINNNPETVSTDYLITDKLYFEPLTIEDVMNIVHLEKPIGVIVELGGQTAINLCERLDALEVPIIGTGKDAIARAENRELFEELLKKLNILRPAGKTVLSLTEGLEVAQTLGYPVLVRPSYVLGGRAMQVVYNDKSLKKYLHNAFLASYKQPVLIDKYIIGKECEIDAVCDGNDVVIPGVMELVEGTGIHSGDSISVYPPMTLSSKVIDKMVEYTIQLGKAIGIIGLYNIQFIVDSKEKVYIIEVNPRSSRTIPFISKATKVNLANLATKVILGKSLKDLGYQTGLLPRRNKYYVKAPTFSFSKLSGMDLVLSPEMKSTGEAIGYDHFLNKALYKALIASNMRVVNYGTIFVTLSDMTKEEALPLIKRFYDLGFNIEATSGTGKFLKEHGIRTRIKKKLNQGSTEILDSLRKGHIAYVINTPGIDETIHTDGYLIRRVAIENNVPLFTSLYTVGALLNVLDEITMKVGMI